MRSAAPPRSVGGRGPPQPRAGGSCSTVVNARTGGNAFAVTSPWGGGSSSGVPPRQMCSLLSLSSIPGLVVVVRGRCFDMFFCLPTDLRQVGPVSGGTGGQGLAGRIGVHPARHVGHCSARPPYNPASVPPHRTRACAILSCGTQSGGWHGENVPSESRSGLITTLERSAGWCQTRPSLCRAVVCIPIWVFLTSPPCSQVRL
mmetsp:Transcript_21447/g.38481  ORF Transcript_21447/g.38481 Transcript_21447/m.38481 type:complete len:202 (+) Transcript_21447:1241-1846(+)